MSALVVIATDLIGGWSWTVWLLIPLTLVLAVLTALVLGPLGEPTSAARRDRGVNRFLSQHATDKETR